MLRSFIPKGKAPDYYHRTRRGLGYVSTPILLASESKESLYHNHSSSTSSWESDVSVGDIFKDLSVNMVSTSHQKNEDEEIIQSDKDPQIKHLNTLQDICFEQHEPPTEDKVTKINMGDEANPTPIFITESLSPPEKEDLICLVREYIDVFTWNYKDMPGLDPQVVLHRLNINSDAKPVNQQQQRFRPEIIKMIQSKVKKLINSSFIRKEQHPDWVAKLVPVTKKNEKIQICIDP